MSHISWQKFMTFSILNTLVWDIIFSSAGYYFGAFLKENWQKIEYYEFEIMAGIVVAGIITGLALRNFSMKGLKVK